MRFLLLLLLACGGAFLLQADSIGVSYASTFAFTAWGAPTGLKQLGGLVIDPANPNVLLIGANANTASGAIYSAGLTRDPSTNRITGFSGAPALYAFSPDIDGGLTIAPDDDLLVTEYPDNKIGEIKPGSTSPDSTVASPFTSIQASTGGMTFIPAGFGGAGNVVFTSYNHSVICAATPNPDGHGTYSFSSCSNSETPGAPLEGILYVPSGTGGFSTPTALISTYSQSTGWSVQAYQVDGNGMPILSASSVFFSEGAGEGLALDPVTGDILMTNYTLGSGSTIYDVYSTIQPTPEPGSFILLTVGLTLLDVSGQMWKRS